MSFAIAGLLSAALLVATGGRSDSAETAWQDLGGGKARMVAQMDPGSGRVDAMVEIVLNAGWKTYWREPGGSGIPPHFDFTRSRGFAAGEIQFPVPLSLTAADSRFAGYKDEVAFLFSGEAIGQDGVIALDLLAGVCEEICIPATASFEIPFSDLLVSNSSAAAALSAARARLPGEPRMDLKAEKVEIVSGSARIEAVVPAGVTKPQLFVEGPDGWYFGQAELIDLQAGKARFKTEIIGRPMAAQPTTRFRLTLSDGSQGITQEMEADTDSIR